jgi:iron complex outermembrane receptor protein
VFKLAIFFVCAQTALFAFASGPFTSGATVKGTITDSSGAVVPAATITLHPIADNSFISAVSDAQGNYAFEHLAPGKYYADVQGKSLVLKSPADITLSEGQQVRLDMTLVAAAVHSQVTVTGADSSQPIDATSKALDIVDVAEAQERGLFAVSDALRTLPGLRVVSRGGPDSFTTIDTRGLPVADTAVLIDGYRFRDVTAIQGDASAYLGDFMLVDSSRIEVLHGSGASLYGTNSVGGTVNIITDTGGGPIHGDVDVQGGGLGLFQGSAKLAGGAMNSRLDYSAGLATLNVSNGVDDAGAVRDWSGQGSVNYAITPGIRIGVKEFANTGFLQENVSPQPTNSAYSLVGIFPAIATGPNATFIPSLGDPDAGRYSYYTYSLFHFDHQVTRNLSYKIGYALVDTVRDNRDGPGGPGLYQPSFNTSDKYSGRTDTLQARVSYVAGSHQVLSAGYEFEREHYLDVTTDQNPVIADRANYRTDARQRTNSAFAQDKISLFGDRLQFLFSGRFTGASLSQPSFLGGVSPYAGTTLPSPPSAYTGDASVAYFFRKTSTKLRSHIGNAFRLPSIYERFGGYLFDGVDYAYGDPRLAPERYVSGDFGVDQYLFKERLKLSSSYFYTQLQEEIGFLEFPPGYVDPYGRTGGYYNTPGGISRGVELSGEFRPSSKTVIIATYTYTNAQDRASQYYTGTDVDPLDTPRIMRNSVNITAMQNLGHHVDAAMDFQGGSNFLYPLYGYAYQFNGPRQLGISGGYTHSFGEKYSARFYFRISNALNQDYFEDGFQTPRRWAVGGIHLTF